MRRLLLVLVPACWSAPTSPPTASPGISVELASVSLADDCGTAAAPVDPVAQAEAFDSGEAACQQTTMQLRIRASAAGAIRIQRIELVDRAGVVVDTLHARNPSRWTGDGYQPWSEHVVTGERLTASYALTAPRWGALPGGRDPAAAGYRVRVTIAVGDDQRTLDRPATLLEAPALPEPEVIT